MKIYQKQQEENAKKEEEKKLSEILKQIKECKEESWNFVKSEARDIYKNLDDEGREKISNAIKEKEEKLNGDING